MFFVFGFLATKTFQLHHAKKSPMKIVHEVFANVTSLKQTI